MAARLFIGLLFIHLMSHIPFQLPIGFLPAQPLPSISPFYFDILKIYAGFHYCHALLPSIPRLFALFESHYHDAHHFRCLALPQSDAIVHCRQALLFGKITLSMSCAIFARYCPSSSFPLHADMKTHPPDHDIFTDPPASGAMPCRAMQTRRHTLSILPRPPTPPTTPFDISFLSLFRFSRMPFSDRSIHYSMPLFFVAAFRRRPPSSEVFCQCVIFRPDIFSSSPPLCAIDMSLISRRSPFRPDMADLHRRRPARSPEALIFITRARDTPC